MILFTYAFSDPIINYLYQKSHFTDYQYLANEQTDHAEFRAFRPLRTAYMRWTSIDNSIIFDISKLIFDRPRSAPFHRAKSALCRTDFGGIKNETRAMGKKMPTFYIKSKKLSLFLQCEARPATPKPGREPPGTNNTAPRAREKFRIIHPNFAAFSREKSEPFIRPTLLMASGHRQDKTK